MNRRKAMKMFAGAVAAGGAGAYALSSVFRPEFHPMEEPRKLEYLKTGSEWAYVHLDPAMTAGSAYELYKSGSCMYAVFRSILAQLADRFGEPYASFPFHMMRYGQSGIAGFGTVCGAINGAAALIGLLVPEKIPQESLITGLFRWYEKANIPGYGPQSPVLDFTPPPSVSDSVLCHASVTNWVKKSGYKADSDQRRERCRRLTSDVAFHTAVILNEYIANSYLTDGHDNENIKACMTCHGNKGKLDNTLGKMECSSCHTESVGHKIFANPHYRFMKDK
jgi:hypothetical protein